MKTALWKTLSVKPITHICIFPRREVKAGRLIMYISLDPTMPESVSKWVSSAGPGGEDQGTVRGFPSVSSGPDTQCGERVCRGHTRTERSVERLRHRAQMSSQSEQTWEYRTVTKNLKNYKKNLQKSAESLEKLQKIYPWRNNEVLRASAVTITGWEKDDTPSWISS